MADPFAGWSAPESAPRSETAAPETDPYAGWSAPVASVAPEEGPGTGEALLRGGAQGATLGYEDELAGVLEALIDKTVGKDEGQTFADRYRKHRDESRKANAAAQSAHPYVFGGADVAGSLASGLALPVGEGLAGALKLGAGLGAASGLGTSQADLTTGDVAEAAKDVATGAGTGLAGGAIGHGIAALGGPLEAAGIRMGKSAIEGGRSPLSSKTALSDDAVKAAIESGALRPFSSIGDISENLNAVRENLGQQYGELVKQLDAAGIKGPNADKLAGEFFDAAKQSSKETLLSPKPAMLRAVGRRIQAKPDELTGDVTKEYNDIVAGLAKNNVTGQAAEDAARQNLTNRGFDVSQLDTSRDLPLSAADAMKQDLQFQARTQYDKLNRSITPRGDAQLAAAAKIKNAIDTAISEQADKAPELAESFQPLKDQLSNIMKASDVAREGANRAERRNVFSLTQRGAGLVGLAKKGLGGGFGYGLGAKLFDVYAPSTASVALYRTGNALQRLVQSNPAALGSYGAILSNALRQSQESFDANAYVLGNTDRGFQEMMKNINEKSQGQ